MSGPSSVPPSPPLTPESTCSELSPASTLSGAANNAVPYAPPINPAPSATHEAADQVAPVVRFPALAHRNFRLFWTGNLLSLIGTLAQQTALGWLVRTLTLDARQAPANLTIVAACNSLPILLFTLYAGVVADRVDKRRILFVTNSLSALLSLVLALMVWSGVIQVWHVALVSLGLGTVNAFDIPVRQSFNVEMVGRRDLPNAIALNSSAFNGARVLGPAVGGFLLSAVGMAGCFFVNAFSYISLLIALGMQKMSPFEPGDAGNKIAGFEAVREGFNFVRYHPILWVMTLLVACVSICAMSYSTLLPVFARDIFYSDERGFVILMTANGAGALGSAASLAFIGTMRHKGKRVLLGAFLFCLSVVGFASSPHFWLACFFLVLAGWFLLTFLMTANTLVQTIAPDELRGRVFSVYSLALIGTAPIGALLLGQAAKYLSSSRLAVQLGAMMALSFTFWIYVRYRELWKEK